MNDVPPSLPELAEDAHKASVGRVLCFAGARTMPGAAILVVRAAQRAGAGLVTLAVLDLELIPCIAAASPETVYLDLSEQRDLVAGRLPRPVAEHTHDARVVGPGLGQSGRARQLVLRLLDAPFTGPLALDADALNVIGTELERIAACPAPIVVTPHPGEAARLLGRPVGRGPDERRAAAEEIATRARAVCVLKGSGSVVSDGTRTWINRSGNPGMATAGSGDVLTGILGAYLGAWARRRPQGETERWPLPESLLDVVRRAVFDHGRAGDRAARLLGPRRVIASDLVEHLGDPPDES